MQLASPEISDEEKRSPLHQSSIVEKVSVGERRLVVLRATQNQVTRVRYCYRYDHSNSHAKCYSEEFYTGRESGVYQ